VKIPVGARVRKAASSAALAALLLGISALALIRVAAAGTKPTIFVASFHDVTAFPLASRGNVAPIALTTDMASPSGIARDASGRIYVTNSATSTVTIYAANSNGNVPPLAVIGGSSTRLVNPTGIALDSTGKIHVLNISANGRGSITVYPPLGAGIGILNEAPIAEIAGIKTLLDDPLGIAIDSQNNIYVANERGGPVVRGKHFDKGSITVYPAGSDGNIAPLATISGKATGLSFPVSIALDSSDNIYVGNFYIANVKNPLNLGGSITVYPAGSKGNASPSAIIAGGNTGLDDPGGIALDSSGNLYVTSLNCSGLCSGNGFGINIYPPGSSGNVFPSAVINGADTEMSGSDGLALDSLGRLYVSNLNGGTGQGGSVTVYGAGSVGDAVPTATITSNFTGLPFASDVAVDSGGNLYVSNTVEDGGEFGSIDIYPAGSFATGPPVATIAGADTGLDTPLKIAVDSIGNIYVLNVGNVVTAYASGSTGDATPMATLNVGLNANSFATSMAVDPSGKLYVASLCITRHCLGGGDGAVAVYPPGSDGDATPSTVIAGPKTKIATPSAVAVDQSGSIYVTSKGPMKCKRVSSASSCSPNGHGSITVYGPGSNGNVTPTATITGANTGLQFPFGISLDSNGNIYVLNGAESPFVSVGQTQGAAHGAVGVPKFFLIGRPKAVTIGILIFAAGSNGDAAPIGNIGGPFSGLDAAEGIAIGPASP
jgi:6-phosphogluconolactonase (cycloisomerase 2 family)